MTAKARRNMTTTPEGRERALKQRPQPAPRKQRRLEAKLASADRLVARRTRQLGSASTRRAALAAKLARRATAGGDATAPMAYCLKDRRQVLIGGARPVVLSSGRAAVAGTCPSCGSKVVRLAAS